MKKTIASLMLVALLLCSCSVQNISKTTITPSPNIQNSTETQTINMDSIKENISKICSFPRKAGTTAEKAAAGFITQQFQNYGYEPVISEFSYESKRTQKLPGTCLLTIPEKNDYWIPDCYIVKYSGNGNVQGPFVYFDDEKVDCNGALALIPWRDNLQELISSACNDGAIGILIFAETEDATYDPMPWECIDKTIDIPLAGIGWDDAKKIIKTIKTGPLNAMLDVEGASWVMTSQNVTAIKNATTNNPEILILGAHYDSFAGVAGASDDASGVAVLLEIARILQGSKGDAEIHFVAFGAGEEGSIGAKNYADSLSDEQKKRIAGMIDIERLGSSTLSIDYAGDHQSLIGDILRQAVTKLQKTAVPVEPDDRGGHAAFSNDGIDTVMLSGEDEKGYCKTARDKVENMDCGTILEGAEALLSTALEVMDPAGKLTGDPRKAEDGNRALTVPISEINTDSVLFTGETRYEMQKRLGITGVPYRNDEIPNSVAYQLKWFGMSDALQSIFHFDADNYLCDAEVKMQDAGYTFDEALRIMEKALGKPEDVYKEKNHSQYNWYGIYGKMHMLEQDGDSYRISIYQSPCEEKVIKQYNVKNGEINFSQKDAKYKEIWDMASSIMLPEYKKAISKFTVFTDGVSGKLAQVQFLDGEKTKYDLGFDYWDVFDENGNIRDKKAIMEVAAHEYGHMLTISNEQVDLTVIEEKDVFNDIGTYKSGSYLEKFYDEFYTGLEKDAGILDEEEFYAKYIELFPSHYACTSPSEDLAECFSLFATGDLADLPTDKYEFLMKYPELVRARNFALAAMEN